MASFSIITQSAATRALVQQGLLTRVFEDGLLPRFAYRGAEADPEEFPANSGDEMIRTGKGIPSRQMAQLVPSDEPEVITETFEQWNVVLGRWSRTIVLDMATAAVSPVSLFTEKAHTLGIAAAQDMDGNVRNALFNAALAGHTVADGAQAGVNVLRVARLNGFTRARAAAVTGSSTVRHEPVSSSNPLKVTINTTTGEVSRYVIAVTADNAGDVFGPGTITLATFANPPVAGAGANVTVADRAYVLAVDRTSIIRAGGGNSIDGISSANKFSLSLLRSMTARLRSQGVVEHANGFHCHFDSSASEIQIQEDSDLKQIFQSIPDSSMNRDGFVGRLFGCAFYRSQSSPSPETVDMLGAAATGSGLSPYSSLNTKGQVNDPFGGEVKNPSGTSIHRVLVTGFGFLKEYYLDQAALISPAGISGTQSDIAGLTNDGIELMAGRVKIIIAPPINANQDKLRMSYSFIGQWTPRTDASGGTDAARYKRGICAEHGI